MHHSKPLIWNEFLINISTKSIDGCYEQLHVIGKAEDPPALRHALIRSGRRRWLDKHKPEAHPNSGARRGPEQRLPEADSQRRHCSSEYHEKARGEGRRRVVLEADVEESPAGVEGGNVGLRRKNHLGDAGEVGGGYKPEHDARCWKEPPRQRVFDLQHASHGSVAWVSDAQDAVHGKGGGLAEPQCEVHGCAEAVHC